MKKVDKTRKMNSSFKIFSFFLILSLSTMALYGQGLGSQTTLNGFQLGQFLDAAEIKYGKPYLEQTSDDNWLIKVWKASKTSKTLIIFECAPPEKNTITTIQLFGEPSNEITGMGSVNLGTSKTDLLKILGEPSEVKEYTDKEVIYILQKYEGKNYSVELNKEGIVVSIKIKGYVGFDEVKEVVADIKDTEKFLSKNSRTDLREILRPDFEIYKDNKVIKYKSDALTDLLTNSDLKEAIYGKKGLESALKKKGKDFGPEMRVSEQGPCSSPPYCCVWKFPNNNTIKEIVFSPYAGKWRIYEIQFR